MTRRSTASWRLAAALMAALPVAPAPGASDLKRGDPAPPIALAAMDGTTVDTAQMRGKVLLVLFGEAAQDRTQRACNLVMEALDSPRLAGEPITWILVLSKGSRPQDLDPQIRSGRHAPLLVHDSSRTGFGAYNVLVVPSVVVVDRDGLVVHALAGLTDRFGDILFDALSFASGKLSAAQFDESLRAPAGAQQDAERLRAQRLARFARRLAEKGLEQLAREKYLEALQIAPLLASARLGLGDLYLGQGRFDEAEACYRQVLEASPPEPDALLGLAHVELLRGGTVDEAAVLVEGVLRAEPQSARAHYLEGLIHERRGETAAAAASFKRAAELLLARAAPQEDEPQEEQDP